MPTVLRVEGYRFYFFSDEHLPIHIHVKKGGANAKITLVPEIELDRNHGFKPGELKKIFKIVEENYDFMVNKWNETFNQ